MKIDGEYTFDAPQHLVWEAVQDPDVLGSIVPGGEGVEEIGENEYSTKLKVKVGPVQGKFDGNIKLSNIDPPNSYDIQVDGKGAPGFVKASGNLKLEGQGDKTHMIYVGDAQIGGRIASVGQRLMDSSAKSIINQSLNALNEYLKVQVEKENINKTAVETSATEEEVQENVAQVKAPEYIPPSQNELAMNVARDVANDIIPAQYWPYIIGAVVLIVLIILYVLLT